MATAQSKLDILINAKQQGAGVKQATSDLKQLDQAAGVASKGIQGLALAGGVAGLAALGTQIVSTGMELARLSAQATDVEASFRSMAGGAADEMFKGLRESSRGAIADFDLMLSANRAMLLGVADSAQEMTALMDVARARSQAMGTTTTEAFGDLIVGLGRGSTAILDNLGIMLDADTVNKQYADSIGKTVTKLTDQEKKQALVNAVIRESADLVKANADAGDDAASNFERMDAAIQNTKVALGEFISPAAVVGANLLTGYLEGQIKMLKNEQNALESGWIALKNFATGGNEVTSATLRMAEAEGKADDVTRRLTFGLTGLGEAARTGGDGLTAMELKAANLATRLAALKAQSDATRAALSSIESSAVGSLTSSASAAVGVMGASDVARIYEPAKKKLIEQIELLQEYGYEGDALIFKSQELAEKLGLPFTTATEAAAQAERDAKAYGKTLAGEVTDAAKDAEQAFNDLQSTVAGVLSSALNSGTGVDPDDVLEKLGIPRPDAINESARRIADIAANGLKGQDWLGDFANDVPNIWRMIRTAQNPQEEAAYLLRDFQDGLLTAAIDKGKAKEIVRRQIMGDQSMAELALEIANELAAEMGVPLQQALASAQGALGVGGATGTTGSDAARSFNDGAQLGLEESGGGGAFVDSFVSQMRASYSLLKTAGKDAAKAWGSEFLAYVGESVPPGLVSILTQLVTPGVISSIAQQGTLQGAAN